MAVSSCLYIQSISDWILVLWLMLVFDRALGSSFGSVVILELNFVKVVNPCLVHLHHDTHESHQLVSRRWGVHMNGGSFCLRTGQRARTRVLGLVLSFDTTAWWI